MAIPAFADAHPRNQPDLKALIPALGLWSRANDPSFLAHRFIDQFEAPATRTFFMSITSPRRTNVRLIKEQLARPMARFRQTAPV